MARLEAGGDEKITTKLYFTYSLFPIPRQMTNPQSPITNYGRNKTWQR
ncbi:hypothetical protein [Coleofasciculus sp.]